MNMNWQDFKVSSYCTQLELYIWGKTRSHSVAQAGCRLPSMFLFQLPESYKTFSHTTCSLEHAAHFARTAWPSSFQLIWDSPGGRNVLIHKFHWRNKTWCTVHEWRLGGYIVSWVSSWGHPRAERKDDMKNKTGWKLQKSAALKLWQTERAWWLIQ